MQPDTSTREGRKSRGGLEHLVARGTLEDGGWFAVYESHGSTDISMDVYRSDNTLLESQYYDPIAHAYSHRTIIYDADGTTPMRYTAASRNGRLVDEITRTPDHQLERTVHHFPDLEEIMYFEDQKLGPEIGYHRKQERYYRDARGKRVETERHLTHDDKCIQEIHYHAKSKTVKSITDYQPDGHTHSRIRLFTEKGFLENESRYDEQGHLLHHITYHTKGAARPADQKKASEQVYENNILRYGLSYRDNGTLQTRTDYEADGKSIRLVQHYNAAGRHVTERDEYKQGKIAKKILMYTKGSKRHQVRRIILYNEDGKAYRSRECNEWDADTFWDETEIDPTSGHVTSSLIPAPTGVIRQQYNPHTGRLAETEFYREPELGETLRERRYFHPPKKEAAASKKKKPLVIRRVEHFDEDGTTLVHAREFRADGSIKSHEDRDPDNRMVRRVYAPGTKETDDDTAPIFESVIRPNRKLESSTLYAHADPSIISLHKEYDANGVPTEVTLETLQGKETLSWHDYIQRRRAERPLPAGPVRLATVGAEVYSDHDYEKTYTGRTIITLQGEPAALHYAESQLRRRFENIDCELHVGDNGWKQYKDQTGHYCNKMPPSGARRAIEKVNVLKIGIPYQHQEGETWPRTVSDLPRDKDCKARIQAEAAAALEQVFRYTQCDLQLSILPMLSQHKTDKGTEYRPFVRVLWPYHAHLSEEQNAIISKMLAVQITKRSYTCLPAHNRNQIDVLCAPNTFQKGIAEQIMEDTIQKLSRGLIPASLRPPETPGLQA